MKRFFLTLLIACFSLSCFAQEGVKWETGTFQDALNKAKNNKKGPKLIFMDCYTTWCGPCKHMANVVFPTKEAGDYFNKNFVNFKQDMEKGEGLELAKKFSIRAFPTFLVLDAEGNEVGRIIGSDKLESFIERVEKAKDPANSPAGLLAKYEASRNMKDAYTYLETVQRMYMDDKVSAFVKNNYDSINARDKYSSKMWTYISKCISLNDQKILNAIIENKAEFDNGNNKAIVDKSIIAAISSDLASYLVGRIQLTKEDVKKGCLLIKLLGTENNNYENLIARTAKLYSENDIDAIVKLYNPMSIIGSYNGFQTVRLTSIFTAIKEVPDSAKVEYLNNIKNVYDRQIKGTENQIEKIKPSK